MKKKTLLTGTFALMLVFTVFLTGCGLIDDLIPKDQPEKSEPVPEPPKSPEDPPGIFDGIRYKAEPYTGANKGARKTTGIDVDRIKYSFSYKGYDFYYIYLGVLANIPMFSFSTQAHFPSRPSDYTVTVTEEIRESVSQSVSDSVDVARSIIDEYSRENVTGHKLSYDIRVAFPVKKIFDVELGAGGEHTWEQHIGNSNTTGFEETTSLTRTEERATEKARQTMQSRTFFLTSEMPAGFYRFTMFASSDVYLYVIRDSLTNEIAHFELKEFVRPNLFPWNLDFSETGDFGKKDASSFEFDISLLENLPPAGTVTVTFDKNNPDTNGAEVNPQSIMVNIGGNPGKQMPEQPTRPEYSFVGWNTAANGSGTSFTGGSKVTNNITVYAQWLHTPIHRFTLTANPQPTAGGTVNPQSSVSDIFPETPVKITAAPSAHYRFVNWTVESGKAKFANANSQDTTVTLSSDATDVTDVTISANFEPILYTLSVDRNLTDGGTVNPTSQSNVAAGTSVSISATPAGHYRFIRWEIVSEGSEASRIVNSNNASTTVTINSDVTIRAIFEPVQYRLTVERYAPNYGDRSIASPSPYALTQTAINANNISGYWFVKWTVVSGAVEFGNANSASTTVTLKSDATIRANFLQNGTAYGGEVGNVSLENKGGFLLWFYVHWWDTNGVQREYYSDKFAINKSRTIDPGKGIAGGKGDLAPDGSWVRVYSWIDSISTKHHKQSNEYFLYRTGNPATAYYRHTGYASADNTLHFDGVR